MHFKLDHRTSEEIFKYSVKLAREYCPEWTQDWPQDYEKIDLNDFRVVLLKLFAELSEIIIKQLNQVPEKYLIAFLDLLGVSPFPAAPATVPLTFYLAEGAQSAYVSENTQIASSEDANIIFEIEEGIIVNRIPLAKVCSLNPWYGKYTEHPLELEKQKEGFYIFGTDNTEKLIPHFFYLGDKFLLGYQQNVNLTIYFKASGSKFADYFHEWKNSLGEEISPKITIESDQVVFSFENLPANTLSTIHNTQNYWLSVAPNLKKLSINEKNLQEIPLIYDIHADLEVKGNQVSNIILNDSVAEITKGFYPFGETPTNLDTCYIGSKDFSKENAIVSINIGLQKELHHINPHDYFFEKDDIKDLFLLVKRLNDKSKISRYLKEKFSTEAKFILENKKEPEILLDTIVTEFNKLIKGPSLYFSESFKDVVLREKNLYKTSKELSGKELIEFNRNLIEDIYNNEILQHLKVDISWEYWDGKRWLLFEVIIPENKEVTEEDAEEVIEDSEEVTEEDAEEDTVQDPISQLQKGQLLDGSHGFTHNGQVSFICPNIKSVNINGIENHWIRVRIQKGTYGIPGGYEKTKDLYEILEGWDDVINILVKEGITAGIRYRIPEYTPPFVESLSVDVKYSNKRFDSLLSYTNFEYYDVSQSQKFSPYQPVKNQNPALYLGFNENIGQKGFTVYFSLGDIYNEDDLRVLTKPLNSKIEVAMSEICNWKYFNGDDWKYLEVENKNAFFGGGEICKLYIPQDIKETVLFREKLYWIKIEVEGNKVSSPYLKGIHFNTVWAKNNLSIYNEIIGSSNYTANLQFQIRQTPILAGQEIIVKEPSTVSQKEQELILSEEGMDAIWKGENSLWIRWREVKDFTSSSSLSRHYTLNRETGIVTFGDGTKGMMPPVGSDNIIVKKYKSGGGKRGNVEKETVTSLTTAIANIDSVINHKPAVGGNDQEVIEDVIVRGPQSLKTRDRAVTSDDFEWLARMASQEVAKARCIKSQRGQVVIAIVPSDEHEIRPTQTLISFVENFLKKRALVSIRDNIQVIGPKYETIDVEISVTVKSINIIGIVEEQIIKTISKFLHPVKGSINNDGWEFGEVIYISDIIRNFSMYEVEDIIHSVNKIKLTKSYKKQILDEADGDVGNKGWIRLDINALPVLGEMKIFVDAKAS